MDDLEDLLQKPNQDSDGNNQTHKNLNSAEFSKSYVLERQTKLYL